MVGFVAWRWAGLFVLPRIMVGRGRNRIAIVFRTMNERTRPLEKSRRIQAEARMRSASVSLQRERRSAHNSAQRACSLSRHAALCLSYCNDP